MSYQLTASPNTILKGDELIPVDLGNRDYQKFLEWQALGNTPAPYVEPEEIRQSRIRAQLAEFDAKSTRALRELLLDQAGVKNLPGPQRVAARQRLRADDDAAEALRAQLT
jgi:hypothetical protein